MEIRIANKHDDFNQIAELIYDTDQYIYPTSFSDKESAIAILSEMINSQTIFNYNNCLIATINNEIAGLVVFATKESIVNNDYSQWRKVSPELFHMIENYIENVEKSLQNNVLELVCVCIKNKYRRQKIGTSLITYLLTKEEDYNFQLHTLKKNLPAINLYQSLGFTITKELKGYNGFKKRKPFVYLMTRHKTIKM